MLHLFGTMTRCEFYVIYLHCASNLLFEIGIVTPTAAAGILMRSTSDILETQFRAPLLKTCTMHARTRTARLIEPMPEQ